MNNYLSELQDKEIISIATGQSYGHVVDIIIDNNGNIINFIAENKKLFRSIKKEEKSFKYSDIEKIGKDVILVRI